jgi:hypothetical protein
LFFVKHYGDLLNINTPSRLSIWIRSRRKAL